MQGAWLTPEAVPSERERNGHNGECKAELDCLSRDEETNFEWRVLVTVMGGPANWKDKLWRTPGNCADSLYGESIGRGDWIRNAFAGWRPIVVVPRKKTARANPNFRRAIAGGIADGQLRRQPRRQEFRVKG